MKRLIITVCFSLSLSTVSIGMSWSGDYQKGLDAAQNGNYTAALKEWRPLAEQGHSESQFVLGLLYRNGKGVEKDFSTAIKWYLLAAENGHAKAQAKLGYMYVNGEGVNKNYVRAYMWGRLSEINKLDYNLIETSPLSETLNQKGDIFINIESIEKII